MGKIDFETVIVYMAGICTFAIGIIGGLVSYIYRNGVKRSEERWKIHDDNAREWRESFTAECHEKLEDIVENLKEGLKEERQFRYNEMIETKANIKELFESRKQICSNIAEMRAICSERHKK